MKSLDFDNVTQQLVSSAVRISDILNHQGYITAIEIHLDDESVIEIVWDSKNCVWTKPTLVDEIFKGESK